MAHRRDMILPTTQAEQLELVHMKLTDGHGRVLRDLRTPRSPKCGGYVPFSLRQASILHFHTSAHLIRGLHRTRGSTHSPVRTDCHEERSA
jgi:hypothetical protein